ncbi:MAG: Formamidopyrimidine-DNA glycosylase Fpg [Parcubacteria group bacterium GW2011_GWC2_38_7]|nr:MAG: Formamidopyrimidine-DNA glycosylase Fpg [Parcubacteria group bacterium GW2011_GWC2_38_7]
MPELPEVETIKRGLDKQIINKRISKVSIEKSFIKKVGPSANAFKKALEGKTIKNVARRSKLLMFEINKEQSLIVHLKMTGQLVYRPKNNKIVVGGHPIAGPQNLPSKFTRVTIQFADKTTLFFNDVRKFGFLKIVDRKELNEALSKYGREPIDKDFNFPHFKSLIDKSPRKKVKSFLLEQKIIAGLGNIYADESLFVAKVNPERRVDSLTKSEQKLLFVAIVEIIKKAIKYKGTTFSDYVNAKGGKGNFQKHLQVYGRNKLECLRCKKGIITKIKLGSRSASFCPICQK